MKSGAVEAVYISPDEGRVGLVLYNEAGDIVVSYVARFSWRDWSNVVVLNSREANSERWKQKRCPTEFPFPICGHVTRITVRVELGEKGCNISANGLQIAYYEYREELLPPVTSIHVLVEDKDASKKAKLESVSVYY